jgi:hypothetical protein
LDLGHFALRNISLERAKSANAGFPSLHRDFVLIGRQQHTKASRAIGRKRRHSASFIFDDKRGIRERD